MRGWIKWLGKNKGGIGFEPVNESKHRLEADATFRIKLEASEVRNSNRRRAPGSVVFTAKAEKKPWVNPKALLSQIVVFSQVQRPRLNSN